MVALRQLVKNGHDEGCDSVLHLDVLNGGQLLINDASASGSANITALTPDQPRQSHRCITCGFFETVSVVKGGSRWVIAP